MKTSLIFILAFIALVNGYNGSDETDDEPCVPGSTKMKQCNACLCSNYGFGWSWSCTLMACKDPEMLTHDQIAKQADEVDSVQRVKRDEPESCEPGSTKMIECNNCFCVGETETRWACTRIECDK